MVELARIMPCRLSGLQSTIDGFERTGVELVAYDDSCMLGEPNVLGPAGLSDDVGSYYFIPKVVELTGVELNNVIHIFYGGFVLVSLLVGGVFLWRYCETVYGKMISLSALFLLAIIIAGIGDYYVYSGAIPLMFLPWWLFIKKQNGINSIYLYSFFLLFSLIVSVGHLIRSYSGVATLIFILISFLFFSKEYAPKIKVTSILVMLLGLISVFGSFNKILDHRIEYLTSIDSKFELSGDRIKWHNIYYSLGFLSNNYGVSGVESHYPHDYYSLKVAKSIKHDVILMSSEYERILKKQSIVFVKEHPLFFIKSLFAKLGVILMYLVIFMNIGLVLLFYYPLNLQLNLMFLSGIGFNTLFGLVATPEYQYLTGLFAFSVIYSVCIIDNALAHGVIKKLKVT